MEVGRRPQAAGRVWQEARRCMRLVEGQQCDRTEGLEHAATLRATLVCRGRHPCGRARACSATAAASLVGGDPLQFAEDVGDGAQLRLDCLRGRAADLRGGLRARATEE